MSPVAARMRISGRMNDGARVPAPAYATTYVYPWHERWCAETIAFDVRTGRLAALVGLLRAPGPAVLHGATGFQRGYVDLIAAAGRAHGSWPVLLCDATWEPGSRVLDRAFGARRPLGFDPPPRRGRRFSRALIAAMDSERVHYGVLSTHELTSFPATWGVDPARVHFTPFCATASDLDPVPGGHGVLASGSSLRDYRGLIDAAPRIVGLVTIATSLALGPPPASAPNLETGFFTSAEHEERMRAAAVVVVPLVADSARSAGQQTYLNAMARGKPVVVTDAPGVRDYVRDGETGLVVPNEADALASAVNRLLRDGSYARRLGAAARERVLGTYTVRHYVDRVLALADRLVVENGKEVSARTA